MPAPKLERKPGLPALTAVRAFSAINILLFHFSNPHDFGPLAPVIDTGYVAVSFFFVLSGYIMAYNYADHCMAGTLNKREFWTNRLIRLYPVFLVGLAISLPMLLQEWHAQSRPMFWAGLVLTPLLLQAWHPVLATFWTTPAWALSVEIFLYGCFPWLARIRGPKSVSKLLGLWWMMWAAGMVLPVVYIVLHPDGLAVPNRFSAGIWLRALKFFPLQHVPTFVCGILLARIQARVTAHNWQRCLLAVAGVAGVVGFQMLAYHTTTTLWLYPLMHDPLLVPFYSLIIFGLSADHWLSWLIARPAFVFLGEASYCLYILHFNLWQLLHDYGGIQWMHLSRYDPWISYAMLLGAALLAYRWIELPARQWLRGRLRAFVA